jgi:hypothetical protein
LAFVIEGAIFFNDKCQMENGEWKMNPLKDPRPACADLPLELPTAFVLFDSAFAIS